MMIVASATVLTNVASAFTHPQMKPLLTGMPRNSFATVLGATMGTPAMVEGQPAVLDRPTTKIDYSKLRDEKHSSRDKNNHKDSPIHKHKDENKNEDENAANDNKWELWIYDDRANTREKVARVLVQVTARSEWEAFQIMKKADTTGIARVATNLQFEIAEAYNEGLRRQGILSEIKPVSFRGNSEDSEDHDIGGWNKNEWQ